MRNNIWQEEIVLWEHTWKSSPNKLRPLFNLARSYHRKKDFKMAEYYYLKAAHLFPENPDIYNNLGNIYNELNMVEKALKFYLTGLSYGESANLHYNIALALEKKGDLKGALYHYNRNLRLNPSDKEVEYKIIELTKKIQFHRK